MKRKKTISYEWWRNGDEDVKPSHAAALDESAEERITEMANEGYTSGVLTANISMDSDDPEDGVEYSGWWSISTEMSE